MKYWILLFISFSAFSQNKSIELQIDSITHIDSTATERIFTINYHIENLTNSTISFFLDPENLTPISRGSMSKTILYKIYENQELFNLENIFINKKMEAFKKAMEDAKTPEEKNLILKKFLNKEMNMNMDSIKKMDEKATLNWEKELLLKSITTLKEKEKINYSKTLIWDKKRYHKIEDNEFYIDENKPYYIEFTVNLMIEEFISKGDLEDFGELLKNYNFIKGWFTSNKAALNFKE
jgi:hypothetical protein